MAACCTGDPAYIEGVPAVISAVSVPASCSAENEDAVALGEGIGVVVDGAGLPHELRAGCSHPVSWYARELANAFRNRLEHSAIDMRQALAEAITDVTSSHRDACNLSLGSPSSTVAAWRLTADAIEYLVLCDASIILSLQDGTTTEITDNRISHVTEPLIAERTAAIRSRCGVVTPDDVRTARRTSVEQTRNRDGGFWCCHIEPAAAFEAITGRVDRRETCAVIAASDGATRGHQILHTFSLAEFAHAVVVGDASGLIRSIRDAECHDVQLASRAMKRHDDATLVALVLDRATSLPPRYRTRRKGRVSVTNDKRYDGADFYCDVALADPESLNVVYEDECVLAFLHTRPFWNVHVVVVPKRHIGSLTTATAVDAPDIRALLGAVQAIARDVETEHGAAAVLTNLGTYQDSKHLHVHIYSGGRASK